MENRRTEDQAGSELALPRDKEKGLSTSSQTECVQLGVESIPVNPEICSGGPEIRCLDCGGWPIPGGAIFIPVAHCKDETPIAELNPKVWRDFQTYTGMRPTPVPTVGFICELCFVWRLERRAGIISRTSTPKPYYAFHKAKKVLQDKALEIRHKAVGRKPRTHL